MFPSDDSVIRPSASLHWLPRATVRQLHRYYQSAPTSHRPSRPASFRSPGGTTDCCSSRGSGELLLAGSSSELRRCLNPLPSTHSRGNNGISQVPRQPLCEHALLFDPGGPRASGHCDAPDVAFHAVDGVGSAFGHLSRLNHTACSLAVYASRLGLLRLTPRKTRFPLVTNLDGTGLSPAGFHSALQLTSFPPPRGFPGAPAAVTPSYWR